MHILRCMGSKFCVKFQRAPLKFHTKFWTHTPQNMDFAVFYFCVWVTISLNCDVIIPRETGPRPDVLPCFQLDSGTNGQCASSVKLLFTALDTMGDGTSQHWYKKLRSKLFIYDDYSLIIHIRTEIKRTWYSSSETHLINPYAENRPILSKNKTTREQCT